MGYGQSFAGFAADIRVGSGKFHVVAVHLEADLVRTRVGHRQNTVDLVQQFGSVGLNGAFKILRNHGAVVRIRTFDKLRDNLRCADAEQHVSFGGANFDGVFVLGEAEHELEHLRENDYAGFEVCTFLFDACAAHAVTVGCDHGDFTVLGFHEYTVQVLAGVVGRDGKCGLFDQECKFACSERKGTAFDFGERREVAGVETRNGGLALFAPLNAGQVILHVDAYVFAAGYQSLHEVGELTGVDQSFAITFAFDFELNPHTEVQVGSANFESVAFETQRIVVKDLQGGLIGDGADSDLERFLQYGFLDIELHLCASLDKHGSNKEDNGNSAEDCDNLRVQRIGLFRCKLLCILLCASTIATAHR